MDDRMYKSLALYYARIGHYQTMFDIATKARQEFPVKTNEFSFLLGIALKLLDRTEEARREFETLVGTEAIAARILLGETIPIENSESCCIVLLLSGQTKKCREVCQKSSLNSVDFLCILGWAELDLDLKSSAITYFDRALKMKPKDFEANLGKAKCHELLGDLDKSLDVLNHLVVRHPNSSVPLIEKMNLHLALCDWEQALEFANRIQNLNANSIEASKIKVLKALCLDGNFEEANANIRKLRIDIEKTESKNARIFYDCAKLISRICCRNAAILDEIRVLAEKATQLSPTNSDYLTELAHVTLLQGKVKDAIRLYKSAVKLDNSSLTALCGLTYCQLLENLTEGVKQQIELLKELQNTNASAMLLYMCALIHKKDTSLLVQAIQTHSKALESGSFGTNYLLLLDPDFILEVIKELLKRLPRKCKDSSEITMILTFLKPIVHSCPGIVEARILQAEALYINGDTNTALSQLRRFTDSTQAQLLIARILLDQGDISGANKSLEVALSYNFSVRDHPLYLLIYSKQQCEQENYKEATKSLNIALKNPNLSTCDKVSLTLELTEVYKKTGELDEARKILNEAITQFQGSTDEGRLTLAQADLDVLAGKYDAALDLLKVVLPHESFYLESRHKMADIYLNHKKDRRSFAACYREVVEQRPGPESQVLLGDAYMQVQEPEKAVEAYESALKRNPRDPQLVRKVGKALVKTHMFGKAINFYTECVKREPSLRQDLAELLLRLRHFDKAETLLKQATSTPLPAGADSSELTSRCSLLLLLAKVQHQAGSIAVALATLSDARDLQAKLIKRLQVEGTSTIAARSVAATIARQMSEHAATQGNAQEAIKLCREALTHKPDDTESLLALAKLFLQVGELSQCQATCGQLLRSDPDNEAACVMLADLAFRRTDYDTASVHFQQLLARQPRFWTALARLVEVMRRAGTLGEAPPFLERAVASGPEEPGLAFCQGLYSWYSGDSSQALKHFNRARRDAEWGRQAICSMVEICLNPDSTAGAALESPEPDTRDSREAALKTAERLLAELKPRPVSEERNIYRLLCCFLALARREKQAAESALQELTMLAGEEGTKCSAGVTLALATAYLVLKQATRARNQLKRVSKQVWSFEEAEYLERCWLLLAELYIQTGKYDVASELLRRALQHNKSCARAYELLGLITEKEQLHREAASNYEQAWTHGGRSNPATGYKLAFNLLKAKRYVDAIDVCHQVLIIHPSYPRIHKDILEKARNSLRS